MAYIKYDHGLSFPVTFLSDGSPKYSDLETSVEASVHMILAWQVHRRLYDNIFGSITSYLHWPTISRNLNFVKDMLQTALVENDVRIEDVRISIYSRDEKIYIDALVKIKNSENIYVKTEL